MSEDLKNFIYASIFFVALGGVLWLMLYVTDFLELKFHNRYNRWLKKQYKLQYKIKKLQKELEELRKNRPS